MCRNILTHEELWDAMRTQQLFWVRWSSESKKYSTVILSKMVFWMKKLFKLIMYRSRKKWEKCVILCNQHCSSWWPGNIYRHLLAQWWPRGHLALVASTGTNILLSYLQVKIAQFIWHYSDVIICVMVSQITGVSIVYSTVCSGADQRKHQSSVHWPLWREFTGDRWIPRTKGQ